MNATFFHTPNLFCSALPSFNMGERPFVFQLIPAHSMLMTAVSRFFISFVLLESRCLLVLFCFLCLLLFFQFTCFSFLYICLMPVFAHSMQNSDSIILRTIIFAPVMQFSEIHIFHFCFNKNLCQMTTMTISIKMYLQNIETGMDILIKHCFSLWCKCAPLAKW